MYFISPKQLVSLNRFSESLIYFDKALGLYRPGYHEPSLAFQSCLNAAQASLSLGDLEPVEHYLDRAHLFSNTDLNNTWLLEFVRAELNERRGDSDSALLAMDKVISILQATPSAGSVKFEKNVCLEGKFIFEIEIFRHCSRVLQKGPGSESALDVPVILEGTCYLSLGDVVSAASSYTAALAVNPISDAARKGLELCHQLLRGKVNA